MVLKRVVESLYSCFYKANLELFNFLEPSDTINTILGLQEFFDAFLCQRC